jgi:hypothetical protein
VRNLTGISALALQPSHCIMVRRNMAAVSPIKRPEEQAPLTRFRRKLADNIKLYRPAFKFSFRAEGTEFSPRRPFKSLRVFDHKRLKIMN